MLVFRSRRNTQKNTDFTNDLFLNIILKYSFSDRDGFLFFKCNSKYYFFIF